MTIPTFTVFFTAKSGQAGTAKVTATCALAARVVVRKANKGCTIIGVR